MKFSLATLFLTVVAATTTDMPSGVLDLALRNGQTSAAMQLFANSKTIVETLELDGGWFKFFFGPAGNMTAYAFHFNYPDYVQISITDAYCPGDSFDLFRDGHYLITTPRVLSRECQHWESEPDVAFINPIFSSTKFMLPGHFNLTIASKDSPYQGGAAFIRADTRLGTCPVVGSKLVVVSAPKGDHASAARICKRVDGVPAHVTPSNSATIAQAMSKCGHKNAWFGRLSLVDKHKKMRLDLGCLAFSAANVAEPTVEIVNCSTELPIVCQIL